jgi:hypothetical protein
MNKLALSLVTGVLVTCGLAAWKINDVSKQHTEALELFTKEFDALHALVKSGMLSVEAGLQEYEILHARGAERCLAHTLDRSATKQWLGDIHKVNVELIKTANV